MVLVSSARQSLQGGTKTMALPDRQRPWQIYGEALFWRMFCYTLAETIPGFTSVSEDIREAIKKTV